MDESPTQVANQRARSVETQLRAKNIAGRLFDDDAAVEVDRFVVQERLGMGAMGAVYRAYDPTLDRVIALKVLHPDRLGLGSDAERGMRREAKALARLSHPNVVTVHEVGGHDDQVWIAMEWVDGGSLGALLLNLEGADRFDSVVALMLQAGEGLAAAHSAGVVHRDFKPANVLVGSDGRVRVADFGLARRRGALAETVEGCDRPNNGDTVGVGTPAYMAPEQRDREVDARADQYAYCVVFWEALFGTRPEPDPSLTRGLNDALPRARALAPVLRQGLRLEPEQRHADMAALLSAIRAVVFEVPRRRRRRRILGATAGLLGATAAVTWALSPSPEDPCSGSAEHLARQWAPEDRARTLQRLAELDTPYATEATPLLAETLDAFATAWVDVHTQTCRAHARQEHTDRVFEHRMSCLDQAAAGLAALAEQSRNDPPRLSDLVTAAATLPSPRACATVQAQPDAARPPDAIRDDVDTLDAQLARARTHLAAGAPLRALHITDGALQLARALDFGPVIARVLHERGRIATTVGPLPALSLEAATEALEEASRLALQVEDQPLAVEAWARSAWLRGTSGGNPESLLEQSALITAMAQGPTSPSVAEALLYNNLGGLNLVRADRDTARGWFRRSEEIAAQLAHPTRELENASLNLALITVDNAQRDTRFDAIVAARTKALGETHPQVLEVRLVQATTTASFEVARRTLDTLADQYRLNHPTQIHQRLEVHEEGAWSHLAAGQTDAALRHLRAATDLDGADPAARDVALGFASLLDDDAEAARTHFRRVLELPVDSPWQRGPVAHAHLGLALVDNDVDQLQAAAALFAQLSYLPTAVIARRIAVADKRLGAPIEGAAEAVQNWRTGAGDRKAIDAALQALSRD